MGLVGRPIFPRLARRFLVRQQSDQQLETGAMLVPTTNADELLLSPKTATIYVSATGATHTFTVPAGKRWHVKSCSGIRESGQAQEIKIQVTAPGGGDTIIGQGLTTGYILYLNGLNFKLDEGSTVVVDYTASVGAGDITSSLIYEEEDLF